jgi:uncharacterized phage protein (TIGR02216 family)
MINWASLMRIGLTHLRLLPDQFWQLTPVELMLMAGLEPGTTPTMTRARLDDLCAQYPDR